MSIASRITSIENNIRNAYHGLESIGLDTSNVDKNIENISAVLDDFYDTLPKVSGSGTNINLTPTLKGRITSQIKGDTLQDGTPTPTSPVAIQSVTGNQVVSVCGKNLFNKDLAVGGINSTTGANITNAKRLRTVGYIDISSSTTYTINCTATKTIQGVVYEYDENEGFLQLLSSTFTTFPFTFTTSANAKKIRFVFKDINETNMATTDMSNIQLEFGSTATTYETFNKDTYSINLGTIELNKIGTYQDYISGTPDNWVINRQIGSIILNGNEDNWSTQQTGTNNWYYRCLLTTNANTTENVRNQLKCNRYSYTQVYTNNTNNGIYIGANEVRIRYGTEDTISNYKIWLSSNNVKITYVLATPTTTPITNQELITQLNNWYYAMSKNGQTNISVDGSLPAILDVSALKGEE